MLRSLLLLLRRWVQAVQGMLLRAPFGPNGPAALLTTAVMEARRAATATQATAAAEATAAAASMRPRAVGLLRSGGGDDEAGDDAGGDDDAWDDDARLRQRRLLQRRAHDGNGAHARRGAGATSSSFPFLNPKIGYCVVGPATPRLRPRARAAWQLGRYSSL